MRTAFPQRCECFLIFFGLCCLNLVRLVGRFAATADTGARLQQRASARTI